MAVEITRESIYELQKIDCNCNDCGHMKRDLGAFNKAIENDKRLSEDVFNLTKVRKIEKTKKDIENLYKNIDVIKNAREKIHAKNQRLQNLQKSVFVYQAQQTKVNYGFCSKYSKDVTFIPVTCQPQTQHCFVHRKDLLTHNPH